MTSNIKKAHRLLLIVSFTIVLGLPLFFHTLQLLYVPVKPPYDRFFAYGIIFIFTFFYLYKNKLSLVSVKVSKTNSSNILLALLIGILILPLLLIIGRIQTIFTVGEWYSSSTFNNILMQNLQNKGFFHIFVIGWIVAISEELLFRGILLKAYSSHKISTAILMTSFLFAISHFQIQNVLFAFIMGIILALVTIYSGSIIPSVILHFIVNETFSILMYFPEKIYSKIFTFLSLSSVSIISLIVCITLLSFLYLKVKKDKEYDGKKERIFDPYIFILITGFMLVTYLQLRSLFS